MSRRPAGERLGHRHDDPRHRHGDWQLKREAPPEEQGGWPDGRRPPLRDNLTEET